MTNKPPALTPSGEALLRALAERITSGDMQEAVKKLAVAWAQAPVETLVVRTLLEQAKDWHSFGHVAAQRQLCELVLRHDPAQCEAMHLLAFNHHIHGDFTAALSWYERAFASNITHAPSLLALAQLRMMQSDFHHGRAQYEARFSLPERHGPDLRELPIPRWRGGPLNGKRIYLWTEQGLGDMVMFAGFLPYLEAQSPVRIALGVFPKLLLLFARSFADIAVEPIDEAILHALPPIPPETFTEIEKQAAIVPMDLAPLRRASDYREQHGTFDYAAPMGDLLVYGLPGYRPAAHGPYLKADALRQQQITQSLATPKRHKRIGIAWCTGNRWETTRSIPLAKWLPLLKLTDTQFVSLQHQVSAGDIQAFCRAHQCAITTLPDLDLQQDWDGLAALIASMDEVITIDNSVAHLAGALGIKTTLLLPLGHNFRWPEKEGGRCHWYKSVRILRQKTFGQWDEVMDIAAFEI